MLIAQGAVDACKIGVTIAVRYAAQRPQFGGKIILEYLTHQRRLFPALATTYAMHIALSRLKVTCDMWTLPADMFLFIVTLVTALHDAASLPCRLSPCEAAMKVLRHKLSQQHARKTRAKSCKPAYTAAV